MMDDDNRSTDSPIASISRPSSTNNLSHYSLAAQQAVGLVTGNCDEISMVPSHSVVSLGTSGAGMVGAAPRHASQSKYAQLLAVIEDLGKDIRPTYAGSKSSAERLKRGIVHARILVRECLMETERSARN